MKAREVQELGEGLREQQSKKNSLAATLGELKTRQQQFADWQSEFAQKASEMSGQFGLDDVAEDVASNEDEIDRVMRLVVKAVATATKKVTKLIAQLPIFMSIFICEIASFRNLLI